MTIDIYTKTKNDNLIINFQEPEELKARHELVYLSDINTQKKDRPRKI